jgi:hypothetical protein
LISVSLAGGVAAAVPWVAAVLWYLRVTLRDRIAPAFDAAAGHQAWLILRRAELAEAEQSAERACEAAEREAGLAVTADSACLPVILNRAMEWADRAAAAATAASICARQITTAGTAPAADAFAARAAAAVSQIAATATSQAERS